MSNRPYTSKIPKFRNGTTSRQKSEPKYNKKQNDSSFMQLNITKVYFLKKSNNKRNLEIHENIEGSVTELANKISTICNKIKDVESCMFLGKKLVNAQMEVKPTGYIDILTNRHKIRNLNSKDKNTKNEKDYVCDVETKRYKNCFKMNKSSNLFSHSEFSFKRWEKAVQTKSKCQTMVDESTGLPLQVILEELSYRTEEIMKKMCHIDQHIQQMCFPIKEHTNTERCHVCESVYNILRDQKHQINNIAQTLQECIARFPDKFDNQKQIQILLTNCNPWYPEPPNQITKEQPQPQKAQPSPFNDYCLDATSPPSFSELQSNFDLDSYNMDNSINLSKDPSNISILINSVSRKSSKKDGGFLKNVNRKKKSETSCFENGKQFKSYQNGLIKDEEYFNLINNKRSSAILMDKSGHLDKNSPRAPNVTAQETTEEKPDTQKHTKEKGSSTILNINGGRFDKNWPKVSNLTPYESTELKLGSSKTKSINNTQKGIRRYQHKSFSEKQTNIKKLNVFNTFSSITNSKNKKFPFSNELTKNGDCLSQKHSSHRNKSLTNLKNKSSNNKQKSKNTLVIHTNTNFKEKCISSGSNLKLTPQLSETSNQSFVHSNKTLKTVENKKESDITNNNSALQASGSIKLESKSMQNNPETTNCVFNESNLDHNKSKHAFKTSTIMNELHMIQNLFYHVKGSNNSHGGVIIQQDEIQKPNYHQCRTDSTNRTSNSTGNSSETIKNEPEVTQNGDKSFNKLLTINKIVKKKSSSLQSAKLVSHRNVSSKSCQYEVDNSLKTNKSTEISETFLNNQEKMENDALNISNLINNLEELLKYENDYTDSLKNNDKEFIRWQNKHLMSCSSTSQTNKIYGNLNFTRSSQYTTNDEENAEELAKMWLRQRILNKIRNCKVGTKIKTKHSFYRGTVRYLIRRYLQKKSDQNISNTSIQEGNSPNQKQSDTRSNKIRITHSNKTNSNHDHNDTHKTKAHNIHTKHSSQKSVQNLDKNSTTHDHTSDDPNTENDEPEKAAPGPKKNTSCGQKSLKSSQEIVESKKILDEPKKNASRCSRKERLKTKLDVAENEEQLEEFCVILARPNRLDLKEHASEKSTNELVEIKTQTLGRFKRNGNSKSSSLAGSEATLKLQSSLIEESNEKGRSAIFIYNSGHFEPSSPIESNSRGPVIGGPNFDSKEAKNEKLERFNRERARHSSFNLPAKDTMLEEDNLKDATNKESSNGLKETRKHKSQSFKRERSRNSKLSLSTNDAMLENLNIIIKEPNRKDSSRETTMEVSNKTSKKNSDKKSEPCRPKRVQNSNMDLSTNDTILEEPNIITKELNRDNNFKETVMELSNNISKEAKDKKSELCRPKKGQTSKTNLSTNDAILEEPNIITEGPSREDNFRETALEVSNKASKEAKDKKSEQCRRKKGQNSKLDFSTNDAKLEDPNIFTEAPNKEDNLRETALEVSNKTSKEAKEKKSEHCRRENIQNSKLDLSTSDAILEEPSLITDNEKQKSENNIKEPTIEKSSNELKTFNQKRISNSNLDLQTSDTTLENHKSKNNLKETATEEPNNESIETKNKKSECFDKKRVKNSSLNFQTGDAILEEPSPIIEKRNSEDIFEKPNKKMGNSEAKEVENKLKRAKSSNSCLPTNDAMFKEHVITEESNRENNLKGTPFEVLNNEPIEVKNKNYGLFKQENMNTSLNRPTSVAILKRRSVFIKDRNNYNEVGIIDFSDEPKMLNNKNSDRLKPESINNSRLGVITENAILSDQNSTTSNEDSENNCDNKENCEWESLNFESDFVEPEIYQKFERSTPFQFRNDAILEKQNISERKAHLQTENNIEHEFVKQDVHKIRNKYYLNCTNSSMANSSLQNGDANNINLKKSENKFLLCVGDSKDVEKLKLMGYRPVPVTKMDNVETRNSAFQSFDDRNDNFLSRASLNIFLAIDNVQNLDDGFFEDEILDLGLPDVSENSFFIESPDVELDAMVDGFLYRRSIEEQASSKSLLSFELKKIKSTFRKFFSLDKMIKILHI